MCVSVFKCMMDMVCDLGTYNYANGQDWAGTFSPLLLLLLFYFVAVVVVIVIAM